MASSGPHFSDCLLKSSIQQMLTGIGQGHLFRWVREDAKP